MPEQFRLVVPNSKDQLAQPPCWRRRERLPIPGLFLYFRR
jgi:hypothetical protein